MTAKHCAVPTIVDGGHRFTLLASELPLIAGLMRGGGLVLGPERNGGRWEMASRRSGLPGLPFGLQLTAG